MLPVGALQIGKAKTKFTPDEQYTLLTLWSVARSPLILGADLTKLDDFTFGLITNDEVIAVDQASTGNRELFRRDGFYGWVADAPGAKARYLALFNTRNEPANGSAAVPVSLTELGFDGGCHIRDLWQHQDLGVVTNQFAPVIHVHGAGLYRVSPVQNRGGGPSPGRRG
jgi:hypothetical protein